MSAWGTDILEDDVAADVYADYRNKLDAGMKPADIRVALEEEFANVLEDKDDAPSFWLALAKAQWECKRLQPDVFAKASEIVKTGADLGRWEEAGEMALKERKQALERFLGSIAAAPPCIRRP